MASLEGVLASIPGYGGYLAKRQLNQNEETQGLTQAVGLYGLMQKVQEQQEKANIAGILSKPDLTPEQKMQALSQTGTAGVQLAGVLAQQQKAQADARQAQEKSAFFSPQGQAQFTTPGKPAIPVPSAEVGGGPGRDAVAPTVDFQRMLQAAASRGFVDPEKYADHLSKAEQAKASLAATVAGREAQSYDRQAAINAANERTRMTLEQRREEDLRRQADERRRRDQNLKPGERWAADGNTVEVIPGSSEWNRRANLHSKDWTSLQLADQKADIGIKGINKILGANDKGEVPETLPSGFQRNFGGYNAYVSRAFPDALNTKADIEQLKSTLKNVGLEMMRTGGSIGQMTEREWPIVERMIATVTPELSEAKAKETLIEVRDTLERIRNTTKAAYETEWAQQPQFYKGAAKPKTGTTQIPSGIPTGSNLIGKTPDGKDVYQSPDGRKWVP